MMRAEWSSGQLTEPIWRVRPAGPNPGDSGARVLPGILGIQVSRRVSRGRVCCQLSTSFGRSRSRRGAGSGAGSGAPITVSVCSAICSSATTRVDEGAVCAQAMPHDMDTIRDSMARMERWRMGQTPYRRNQPVPSEFRAFEGGSGELLRRGAPRRGCRLSQALRDGELLPAPCIAAHVIHGSFGLPAKPLQSERGVGEA